MKVLVTGSAGQVGQAIQSIRSDFPSMEFYFADSDEGDITQESKLQLLFKKFSPDFCINTAAYTAVDKAESEPEKAFAINVTGVENLAEICKDSDCILIHISTDFVFDGTKTTPYTEEDIPNPQSVYGRTKLEGEQQIQRILDKYFIIRTSWVYSQFGNNFMKTMLRLAGERDSISVVDDQIGTPTNAVDLATACLTIALSGSRVFGIYNFSHEGKCSWFEFAKKIFEINNIDIDLRAIPTSAYFTAAKRPSYSVLANHKISETFGFSISDWHTRLKLYQKYK